MACSFAVGFGLLVIRDRAVHDLVEAGVEGGGLVARVLALELYEFAVGFVVGALGLGGVALEAVEDGGWLTEGGDDAGV